MLFRFRKNNTELFSLFDILFKRIMITGDFFKKVINSGNVTDAELKKMRDYEHECDQITYCIINTLNTRMKIPFAPETIHALAHDIDNIVDSIYAVIKRMKLYRIKTNSRELIDFSDIVIQAIESAGKALMALQDLSNEKNVQSYCAKVSVLRNAGDQLRDMMTENLFKKTKDPIKIIQSKEIFEGVEAILDASEKVTRTIESILLRKN